MNDKTQTSLDTGHRIDRAYLLHSMCIVGMGGASGSLKNILIARLVRGHLPDSGNTGTPNEDMLKDVTFTYLCGDSYHIAISAMLMLQLLWSVNETVTTNPTLNYATATTLSRYAIDSLND